MQITWYGHAAFLAEGQNDTSSTIRIVLDPYRAPDVGTYAPIDDWADIVALSHINEKYHSFVDTVRGKEGQSPVVLHGLEILDTPQPVTIYGIPFTAQRVWEDATRTEPIAMVGFQMEGVSVLHMGDCGHALSLPEIAACGKVDVVLALAGAGPTIALPDLRDFVRILNPRIVIPMHFLNEKINLPLRPVQEFLDLMPSDSIRHWDTPTLTITPETLPDETVVWVLPPAR
jgi:L-ascorbate metabolism protein UlaG (beta-lactamase superfamily)